MHFTEDVNIFIEKKACMMHHLHVRVTWSPLALPLLELINKYIRIPVVAYRYIYYS